MGVDVKLSLVDILLKLSLQLSNLAYLKIISKLQIKNEIAIFLKKVNKQLKSSDIFVPILVQQKILLC